MTERMLPTNEEAEKAVIGGVILNSNALQHDLPASDFYTTQHQAIWTHILKLDEQELPIEGMAIIEAAKANGGLDRIGGASYLVSLGNEVPSMENVEYYAKVVRDNAKRRRIIFASRTMALKAYDFGDPVEIISDFDTEMLKDVQISNAIKVGDKVMSRFDYYGKLMSGEIVPLLDFGLTDLASKCPIGKDDFIIIGASPGTGKTALALSMALGAALNGHPILFHSMEMPEAQVMDRLVSLVSGVPFERMRTGNFSESDSPKLTRAAGIISELPLFIDDRQGLSAAEIKASVASHKRKNGIEAVFIDYLQIMEEKGKFNGQHEKISFSTKALKNMAKKLFVTIIALAQTKQTVDLRDPPIPHEGDIEGSNEPRKACETMLLIYRQEMHLEKLQGLEDKAKGKKGKYIREDLIGAALVIIGKSRHSAPGGVRLYFAGKTMRFSNFSFD